MNICYCCFKCFIRWLVQGLEVNQIQTLNVFKRISCFAIYFICSYEIFLKYYFHHIVVISICLFNVLISSIFKNFIFYQIYLGHFEIIDLGLKIYYFHLWCYTRIRNYFMFTKTIQFIFYQFTGIDYFPFAISSHVFDAN